MVLNSYTECNCKGGQAYRSASEDIHMHRHNWSSVALTDGHSESSGTFLSVC